MALLHELLVTFFLVAAGIFGLVGSVGLMKLPNPMARLHAPTKATTLGIGGVLLAQMIHITAINLPFMQKVLGTDTITLTEWWYILPIALFLLLVMEIFKIAKIKLSHEAG